MTQIKAVIFDMDGVLIDAKEWHYEALNRALGYFGVEITRYDHLVTYDGLPTRTKLKMLSKEKGLPEGLHTFLNDLKQKFTMEIIFQKCKPIFIHQYALSKLKAEGYTMAVCSNSIRDTVYTMLTKAAILNYFEFFLSNEDVTKGKPDPEMYTMAIHKLGLKPEECLIVEDNEHGVQAALASGAHLYKVESIEDVNWYDIQRRIHTIQVN
ncbi:HAD family hydrolase [Haliscomenobacter sp.]|uniref:HAD family hydrolase n=1 Tax=Haliscomenobacter sp. TaxID=2717303 RepID=UPI003BAA4703